MALIDVHAFSDSLGMQIQFYVLLPQQTRKQIGVSSGAQRTLYPTLWLLHGLSDDHTIWLRRTSIERYAAEKNLAVVMPAVGRSFYQDMPNGARYWTFLSEELPTLCRSWFPLSPEREDNFAAGLSMGGYGAMRLALAKPRTYAAGASLSGALDLRKRLANADKVGGRLDRAELVGIFGPSLKVDQTDAELFHLAEQVAAGNDPKPALYLACGTEDALLEDNRTFHRHLEKLRLAHAYDEGPGDHEWGYWDAQIQQVLEWLPLKDS